MPKIDRMRTLTDLINALHHPGTINPGLAAHVRTLAVAVRHCDRLDRPRSATAHPTRL